MGVVRDRKSGKIIGFHGPFPSDLLKEGFHKEGHLRTGEINCNKCGIDVSKEYSECMFCGPVCGDCAYECFEQNKHCRSR